MAGTVGSRSTMVLWKMDRPPFKRLPSIHSIHRTCTPVNQESFLRLEYSKVQTVGNSGLPSAADPGLFVRINILAIDPQAPSTVYAGLGSSVNGDEVGLYKTVDAGDTWQRIGNGLPEVPITGLAIDPQSSTTLYASTFDIWSGYGGQGVYQSTDGGNSWHPINVGLANPFVFPLAIDPLLPQKLYAGTFGGGVFGVNQSAAYIYLPVISGN
jgi:hypothetical protein